MSHETNIIGAAIKDRDAYDILKRYYDENDFSIAGKLIVAEVDKFYERDETVTHVSKDIIAKRLRRKVSSDEQADFLIEVLDNMGDESVPNVVQELLEMKRDKTVGGLLEALHTGAHTRIMELMDQYKLLQEGLDSNGVVDDSIFIGLDAGTFDKNVGTPEFKINPASLNKRLDGGAAREDHIGVFARPEIGKSLFCINLMSGCLRRGFKGLYFGNEDAAEKMRLRFICNLLNLNKFEVLEDFEANAAEAMAKGGNNLIFKRSDAGTIHELDTIMTHHKPDIFVVDQIRNFTVPGSKDGGLTHTIEQVAKGCRTLAKKHRALAVSVTQAGATAANQSVLEPEDVDYSNTGYFGALDLLIGIGANKQQLDNNRRYLYLSKNKLSDRHEGFTVKFEHATSRVKSID